MKTEQGCLVAASQFVALFKKENKLTEKKDVFLVDVRVCSDAFEVFERLSYRRKIFIAAVFVIKSVGGLLYTTNRFRIWGRIRQQPLERGNLFLDKIMHELWGSGLVGIKTPLCWFFEQKTQKISPLLVIQWRSWQKAMFVSENQQMYKKQVVQDENFFSLRWREIATLDLAR